jgi:hypothetical protein
MVQIPLMPHFEVPQQLRELTERNIKQARVAYGHLVDAMVQITGLWMAALPTNPLTSGFKAVQDRGVRFAKENAEAGFAVTTELTTAKNIEDVLAIQRRFAQSQMQAYASQVQELGRLAAEAAKSFQPAS